MIKNFLSHPNMYYAGNRNSVLNEIIQGKVSSYSFISGQYSEVIEERDAIYLIRDPLGLNKLFYHIDLENKIVSTSNNLFQLATHTHDANSIFSVPAGHFLKISKTDLGKELHSYFDVSKFSETNFDLSSFHKSVSQKLNVFFENLSQKNPESQFVVCLSGGLDSSVIASYAKKYLKNVVAASFSFQHLSDDFNSAKSIAGLLGLDFFPIVEERTFDQSTFIEVLKYGQDWRDFNVHCAWVNYILARNIKKRFPEKDVIVLTGDLMNEFVVDYAPVTYKEASYYTLPRVSKFKLRQFLIYGLDSGDREIGIFNSQGIKVIQPFSFLVEDYLNVPREMLEKPDCKQTLNQGFLSDPKILDFIHKNKLRAQVGGKDGGTLGLFHDYNIGQDKIKATWEDLFSPYTNEQLRPLIEAGRYRN